MAGNDGMMAEKKKQQSTKKARTSAKPAIRNGTARKKAAHSNEPLPKGPCEAESGQSKNAERQEVNGLATVFDLVNKKISDQAERISNGVLDNISKGRMTEMKHVADMMERLKTGRGSGNNCDKLLAELEKSIDCDPNNSIAPENHP